jgi:hypothetical protein
VLSLFTKIDIGIKELLTTDGPRRRDFRDGQALDQVKAVAVESWLSTLKKGNGIALADGSKNRIRDLMHLLCTSTRSAVNGQTAFRLRPFPHGVRMSMSRLATPYDNAQAESFIKTLN